MSEIKDPKLSYMIDEEGMANALGEERWAALKKQALRETVEAIEQEKARSEGRI